MTALLILLTACGSDKAPDSGDSSPSYADDTAPGGQSDDTSGGETEQPQGGCVDEAPALGPETCVELAPCSWSGGDSYAYFGFALEAGGDVDGDGLADVVVGAPGTDANGYESTGQVTLITGAALASGDGLSSTLGGGGDYHMLGYDVAFVGDVDGDGRDDLLAGARGVSTDASYVGEAWLLLGSDPATPAAKWAGRDAYERVGTSVAGAGDVDGDGLADLLIAGRLREYEDSESYAVGEVDLVYGRSDGWSSGSLDLADAVWAGEDSTDGAAGVEMGGADLDGDGYSDLFASAPYAASYKGRVYLIPGGADRHAGESALGDVAIALDGEASYDAFGWSAGTGDVTGDGVADLVIGAPLQDEPYSGAGALYLYAGGPDALSAGPSLLARWSGGWDDDNFGDGITVGRDVDGDGIGDIIAGSVHSRSGLKTHAGKSYVFPGQAEGWSEAGSSADATIVFYGAGVKDYLGRASGAGDVDGDGVADLLIAGAYANVDGGYDQGRIYLFPGGM